jgi:hypothetical protein
MKHIEEWWFSEQLDNPLMELNRQLFRSRYREMRVVNIVPGEVTAFQKSLLVYVEVDDGD